MTYLLLKLIAEKKDLNFNLIINTPSILTLNYCIYDINAKYGNFITNVLNVLDSVAPKNQIKIFPRHKKWWNENVKAATR